MSSIRLFVLGSLAGHGPMHGYEIRQIAERGHIQNWTDVPITGLYGALRRLLAEGLVEEVRTEKPGARPERVVVSITDAGREVLEELRLEILTTFRVVSDPFDLAISMPGSSSVETLPQIIADRLELAREQFEIYERRVEKQAGVIPVVEKMTMQHRRFRIGAEIEFLQLLRDRLPELMTDRRSTDE